MIDGFLDLLSDEEILALIQEQKDIMNESMAERVIDEMKENPDEYI